jgi:hypothetical protein
MTCFIAIAEVSNAWVVFHSLRTVEDYAKKELRDLIKKNNGDMYGVLYIDFENYKSEQLDKSLWNLFDELRKYKISNNVFNIKERTLGKIISDFLNEGMECGLISIYPYQNFIRKTTYSECLKRIKVNMKNRDIEIYNKYFPSIIKARELFSSPQVVKNVQDIVDRIYINPKHSLKHSLFDSEGRRIRELYYSWYKWYDLGAVGTNLMVATGAFGFESHNAILFLAFDRIKSKLPMLEEKKDWRHIDNMLPELISRKLDLLHLFSWMKQKRIFNGRKLIEAAPLAKLIPGDGLHFFKDSIDEDFKYQLKNFYPDIEYVLIE